VGFSRPPPRRTYITLGSQDAKFTYHHLSMATTIDVLRVYDVGEDSHVANSVYDNPGRTLGRRVSGM
jgi:hypothetical protein